MRTMLWMILALAALAGAAQAETYEHEVELHELGPGSYHLTPPVITAKVGDTINLHVVNPAGNEQSHDIVVCGDGVDEDPDCDDRLGFTRIIAPGEDAPLLVALDKAGTFEYYCSIPGHKTGTPGMRGELVVNAAATTEKESPAPALAVGALAVAAAALLARRR